MYRIRGMLHSLKRDHEWAVSFSVSRSNQIYILFVELLVQHKNPSVSPFTIDPEVAWDLLLDSYQYQQALSLMHVAWSFCCRSARSLEGAGPKGGSSPAVLRIP